MAWTSWMIEIRMKHLSPFLPLLLFIIFLTPPHLLIFDSFLDSCSIVLSSLFTSVHSFDSILFLHPDNFRVVHPLMIMFWFSLLSLSLFCFSSLFAVKSQSYYRRIVAGFTSRYSLSSSPIRVLLLKNIRHERLSSWECPLYIILGSLSCQAGCSHISWRGWFNQNNPQ